MTEFMRKSETQTIEKQVIYDKPIQDRLKQASKIKVESASRNKLHLEVSWYDVHGDEQNYKYVIPAGSVIEF